MSSILDLEETCRLWKQVSEMSAGRDAVEQRLQIFHRTLLTKLNSLFHDFIVSSKYFSQERAAGTETDDEEAYFEEVEMSSHLRCYKQLGDNETLY